MNKIFLGKHNGISMYGDDLILSQEALQIEEEKKRTVGLKDFISVKSKEHDDFLGRLTLVNEENYNEAGKIVSEVLAGIESAELDTVLKGDFREANLDWAYSKRAFARNFFEHLLPECKNPDTVRYLTTSCRKLAK